MSTPASSAATPTQSNANPIVSSGSNGGLAGSFQAGASSFYKNLFYILIALLALFGLFSIASWYRGRRRRKVIFAEARRLGLLVPGMPGYALERERLLQMQLSGISNASGKPEIWDVYDERAGAGGLGDLKPISIQPIPDPELTRTRPFPRSDLPLFPNNVAFLAPVADADEGAADWEAGVLEAAGAGAGSGAGAGGAGRSKIQVAVLIRMPVPGEQGRRQWQRGPDGAATGDGDDDDDDLAVVEEWQATEIGLAEVPVYADRQRLDQHPN